MQQFYNKQIRTKEDRYQRVIHHLNEYGNTIVVKDIEYIEERLQQEGVQYKIRKSQTKSEARGKKEIHWYLELSTKLRK